MLTLTNLVCCSINQKSAYALSLYQDKIRLPSINLDTVTINDSTSIEGLIKNLFEKHISIDFDWAKPKLIDIDIYTNDNVTQTHIYYGCYIPYKTILSDSYWVLIDDMIPHSKVLRKVLCLN